MRTIQAQEFGIARRDLPGHERALRKCETCGEAIAPARIEAIPTVSTCVACQTEVEAARNGQHTLSWV